MVYAGRYGQQPAVAADLMQRAADRLAVLVAQLEGVGREFYELIIRKRYQRASTSRCGQ